MSVRVRQGHKIFLVVIILGGLFFWYQLGNVSVSQWYSEEKLLFYGIPVRIDFYPRDEILAHKIWEYLNSVDSIFNDYDATSELGQINGRTTDDSIKISSALVDAFDKSLKAFIMTNGSFDITVKPLKKLWQDKEQQGIPPTQAEIDHVLKICGLDRVSLSDKTLTFTANEIKLDFGGIIKGIAVDSIVEMLKNGNVTSALVQIGGETAVFGQSQRMKPFVIGIQHPIELNELYGAVGDQGDGLSISTSGNYRNPITIGEREYYHIINPKSGWPVEHSVLSVSIVFQNSGNNWLADALTTACVVIGPDKAVPLVEDLGGDILILTKDNGTIREIKNQGWDDLIH